MTLAPARPPSTRRFLSRRAPKTSPPTEATGSRLLIDSRTQRSWKKIQGAGRGLGISEAPGEGGANRLEEADRGDQQRPDEADAREGIRHFAHAFIESEGGEQEETEEKSQRCGFLHRTAIPRNAAQVSPDGAGA